MSLAGGRSLVADTLRDAAVGIVRRPGRSALTTLGTVLGVGAFVVTVGLTSTATAQISSRFDSLKATEVLLERNGASEYPGPTFPPDLETRLGRLNGVRAAGVAWDVGEERARASAGPDPRGGNEARIPVIAVSPGYLEAVRAEMAEGVGFDDFHNARSESVAVLGRVAASQLGITTVSQQPAVFIDDLPFTVVGIIEDTKRSSNLLFGILVPDRTARRIWATTEGSERALIDVDIGAAQLIARQAPAALRPQDPDGILVTVAPEPQGLRRRVETDVGGLFVALAGISLLIGAIGIANTTLVSVLERVNEIGLRRAVGASRRRIASQFLTESCLLGGIGGLVGTSLGVFTVVLVSAISEWTPVVDALYILPAPVAGLLTGFLAGLYPAVKAARIEPVDALRR